MGVLSRIDWHHYVPPLSSRSFLAHYLPLSGAVSHTLFAVHIFNPNFVTRLFPVGDLAVSNSILFNANLGLGFYIFFRKHLSRVKSWDRVEFSVFGSTLFNFGSLLFAVVVKALIPHKTPTWIRTSMAVFLSVFLLTRGHKYLRYIDARSIHGGHSPRRSPVKELDPSFSPASSNHHKFSNGTHE